MAYFTIASINVGVPEGGVRMRTTEIGDRARADDGSLRSSITARKRTWSVTTSPLLTADAATLRAALIANPTITLTGDVVGGASITVAAILSEDVVVNVLKDVIMSFTLEEA